MMKRRTSIFGVIALGLALVISSCSKDHDSKPEDPNPPTEQTEKEQKLTAHDWALKDAIQTDQEGEETSFYQSCLEDDWIKFDSTSEREFEFSSGETVCDGEENELPYGKGVWSFNAAEDTLNLTLADTTLVGAVSTLSDTDLELNFTTLAEEEQVNITLKFEKIEPQDSGDPSDPGDSEGDQGGDSEGN